MRWLTCDSMWGCPLTNSKNIPATNLYRRSSETVFKQYSRAYTGEVSEDLVICLKAGKRSIGKSKNGRNDGNVSDVTLLARLLRGKGCRLLKKPQQHKIRVKNWMLWLRLFADIIIVCFNGCVRATGWVDHRWLSVSVWMSGDKTKSFLWQDL